MDIVDAQVHLGRGAIDATLESMNALGIGALVIDEFWGGGLGTNDPRHILPGFELPNGSWRALNPTAQEASLLHPTRFSYLVRVDRNDPELSAVMSIVASEPAARAVRIQPAWTMTEARAFADGAYDSLFALADRHDLPIFIFIPGLVELLPRYLTKFSNVTVIVDHCGMGFQGIPMDRPEAERARTAGRDYFDAVLRLAQHPNVFLKWAHAQSGFGAHEYPYEPVRAALRKAIAAFGAQRLMWASDNTVIPKHGWANLLSYLRDAPDFSSEEKAWILGRSVRRVLRWPASAPEANERPR